MLLPPLRFTKDWIFIILILGKSNKERDSVTRPNFAKNEKIVRLTNEIRDMFNVAHIWIDLYNDKKQLVTRNDYFLKEINDTIAPTKEIDLDYIKTLIIKLKHEFINQAKAHKIRAKFFYIEFCSVNFMSEYIIFDVNKFNISPNILEMEKIACIKHTKHLIDNGVAVFK